MRRSFVTLSILFVLLVPQGLYGQRLGPDRISQLLELPAPGPVSVYRYYEDEEDPKYPEEFYSRDKVPPDDAPIEDLIAYWSRRASDYGDNYKKLVPSERVVKRLLDAIDEEEVLLPILIDVLPADDDVIETAKRIYDDNLDRLGPEYEEEEYEYYEEEETDETVEEAARRAQQNAGRSGGFFSEFFGGDYPSEISRYQLDELKTWLKFNSRHFVGELEQEALKTRDKDAYVTDQGELLALARLDWDRAEPIAERLIRDGSQPVSATLAMYAYYVHALKAGDSFAISEYRGRLQGVVEDVNAMPGARDLAIDALLKEEPWDGLDDWYIGLLDDETLFDLRVNGSSYTGLTTVILSSEPGKWTEKMVSLVGHRNPAVHNAAVRNLVLIAERENSNEAIRALLPWIADPSWAKEASSERDRLIRQLAVANVPESVPGLIKLVSDPDSANRDAAVRALGRYGDPRAIPVLQAAYDDAATPYFREAVVQALLGCGAYSSTERAAFVEEYARVLLAEGETADYQYFYNHEKKPPLGAFVGKALASNESPDDELVRFTLARIDSLKRDNPALAAAVLSRIQRWNSPVLDLRRLETLGNGEADLESVIRLLSKRKTLGEEFRNDVYALRSRPGAIQGLAACLLDSEIEIQNTVRSNDVSAKTAALACARLIRAKLPVREVAELLQHSDKMLANAAKLYLIAEDSIEARNAVYAVSPGEALILGPRFAFENPDSKRTWEYDPALDALFYSVNRGGYGGRGYEALNRTEAKIRQEVLEDDELIAVYAFIDEESYGHRVLRLYKDKALFTWYEAEARYRERIVPKRDLDIVLNYIADNRLDEHPPVLLECHHGCPSSEFVMVGKAGGRRIFIYSGYYVPGPLMGLRSMFASLKNGESKLRYWLEKKVAGLEVILDEKNFSAKSVWKEGNELHALVYDSRANEEIEKDIQESERAEREALEASNLYDDDEERYYEEMRRVSDRISEMRLNREYEPYSWRVIEGKKIGPISMQPPGIHYVPLSGTRPKMARWDYSDGAYTSTAGGVRFIAGDYSSEGIWKVTADGSAVEIKSGGSYGNIVATPDGRWVFASLGGEMGYTNGVYRIDTSTGKETKVELPEGLTANAIAYVDVHKKVLVFKGMPRNVDAYGDYYADMARSRFGDKYEEAQKSEFFLIDPKTGKAQPVTGEFRPLEQLTYRGLQPAGRPGLYWAAMYDKSTNSTSVGTYDTANFVFEKVTEIPEIELSSMDIWVDSAENRIYFIYEGHLLRLPLKQE